MENLKNGNIGCAEIVLDSFDEMSLPRVLVPYEMEFSEHDILKVSQQHIRENEFEPITTWVKFKDVFIVDVSENARLFQCSAEPQARHFF